MIISFPIQSARSDVVLQIQGVKAGLGAIHFPSGFLSLYNALYEAFICDKMVTLVNLFLVRGNLVPNLKFRTVEIHHSLQAFMYNLDAWLK